MLEGIAEQAGLAPHETFDLSWAYEWPDDDAIARALLSPGLAVQAIRDAGEEPVRAAVLEAVADRRRPEGSYSVENEWHYLIARA